MFLQKLFILELFKNPSFCAKENDIFEYINLYLNKKTHMWQFNDMLVNTDAILHISNEYI